MTRLQYLHREYDMYLKLKSKGWILEHIELPPVGEYDVWLKKHSNDYYETLRFDGHSWYNESGIWYSSGDEIVYAWKLRG